MAPRSFTLTMPESGDKVRTVAHWRYLLVAQWDGQRPVIVKRSDSWDVIRRALDVRIRRPYTYTLTHARPDYAIFDRPTGEVVAKTAGDHRQPERTQR